MEPAARAVPFKHGPASDQTYKFSDLIAASNVRERWEKVRKYFFLRESTYDMSNRCNIRCDGCYYYEGEKQFAKENRNVEAWRELMRQEKARGITIATGDPRAINPGETAGPGGVDVIAEGDIDLGLVIMDAAENWYDGFGEEDSDPTTLSWFQSAMGGIGLVLGVGFTNDLAPLTIQSDLDDTWPLPALWR